MEPRVHSILSTVLICIAVSLVISFHLGAVSPLRLTGPFPSSFKWQVCWLRSFTRITYSCKLIGAYEPHPEAHPSGQRRRCSNLFPTDLSLVCRRPTARNINAITGKYSHRHA